MTEKNAPIKDVRLEVRLRNNLILTRMEHRNIRSVAELCRQMGITAKQHEVNDLVNMREKARNDEGRWRAMALKLANFFDCEPAELFSEMQQEIALEKNRSHAEIAFTEMARLTARHHGEITPELEYEAKQLRAAVSDALQTLTPREERVLRLRFVEEMTLEEAGAEFSVTRNRVSQIEAKALRKLKHPSRLRRIFAATGFITRKRTRWGEEVVEHVIDEEAFKAL